MLKLGFELIIFNFTSVLCNRLLCPKYSVDQKTIEEILKDFEQALMLKLNACVLNRHAVRYSYMLCCVLIWHACVSYFFIPATLLLVLKSHAVCWNNTHACLKNTCACEITLIHNRACKHYTCAWLSYTSIFCPFFLTSWFLQLCKLFFQFLKFKFWMLPNTNPDSTRTSSVLISGRFKSGLFRFFSRSLISRFLKSIKIGLKRTFECFLF
jgi:hypothetical protein